MIIIVAIVEKCRNVEMSTFSARLNSIKLWDKNVTNAKFVTYNIFLWTNEKVIIYN